MSEYDEYNKLIQKLGQTYGHNSIYNNLDSDEVCFDRVLKDSLGNPYNNDSEKTMIKKLKNCSIESIRYIDNGLQIYKMREALPKHEKLLLSGLNDFFYNNQYDEDRFPTFRCMDKITEHDEFGAEYFAYEVCE